MQLRHPEAPASSRQLAMLKQLTGKDWSGAEYTMEEASEMIDKLKSTGGIIEFEQSQKDDFVIPEGQQPFSEPDNTLITGDQRSGKTETGVAIVVDASDNKAVEKFCKDAFNLNVSCSGYDRGSKIAKIKIGRQKKMIRIPSSYPLQSPLKIFANLHLFGVPYHYCPSYRYIVDGLKSGLITDGYLLMDEYYIGGYNRESGGFTNRNLAKYSNQYAKGMLKVIVIAPLANQLDWKARLDPTKVIETEYNKNTQIVTCRVKKKGVPGVKIISYDGRRYRPYYWTNEKINK